MSADKHYEIERKYLIAMPDAEMLEAQHGCGVWEIEQIYLLSEPGQTRRVRRVVEAGQTRYYKTFKVRIDALSCEEDEGEIDRAQYETFLQQANPDLMPIFKTRYRVPFAGQTLEFDVYPFWTDRAVLEIELESADQQAVIPDWVKVYKEVTADYRYKNVRLARCVPMDEI